MKDFKIRVMDRQGNRMTQFLSAESEADAKQKISEKRWYILYVEERRDWHSYFGISRILEARRLALFFRRLATMVQSGISIGQSWRLVIQDIPGKERQARLLASMEQMENGFSLSETMRQSRLFPVLACHVVQAGEESASLDQVFELLGRYYEGCHKQRQSLRNALIYPSFLLLGTAALLAGAIFFILPVFENMFVELAVPLPVATQRLLQILNILRQYANLWVPFICLAAFSLLMAVKSPKWRSHMEIVMLTPRPIKEFFLALCWQRFGRLLFIQLSGGITLVRAIEAAIPAVPLMWFRKRARLLKLFLEQGMSLSVAVKQSGIANVYIETMLTVGESTGKYEEALQAICMYYEWSMENRIKRWQRLLEPAILVLVGITIGSILVCLLLPMFDAAASMSI